MKKDSRQTETEADEKRGKGQERRQRLGNRWIERTHKGESGKGGGEQGWRSWWVIELERGKHSILLSSPEDAAETWAQPGTVHRSASASLCLSNIGKRHTHFVMQYCTWCFPQTHKRTRTYTHTSPTHRTSRSLPQPHPVSPLEGRFFMK